MDLLKSLSAHAAVHPESKAITDDSRTLNYKELEERSDEIAGELLELGVRVGDRVALLSGTQCEVAESLLAVLKVGGIFVPLNPKAGVSSLSSLLENSSPRVLLVQDRFVELARKVLVAQPRVIVVNLQRLPDTADRQGKPQAFFPPLEDDISATLVFSSGTSGVPKGVVSSRRKFSHLLHQHVRHLDICADDRLHLTMPTFHYAGLAGVLGAGLAAGAEVICYDGRFDAAKVLEHAVLHRVTIEHWIPTTILRVVRVLEETSMTLPDLRALHFGSMPISSSLLNRLRAVLDVELIQLYGSTDCGLISVSDDLRDQQHHSIMRLVADSGVRLIDDDGAEPEIGGVGELAVSERVSGMTHYWNEPDRTALTIRQGLIHSGDAAQNLGGGRIRLLGRKDGMIISGGENIYPAEVEIAVASHPAVSEVCVVGKDDEEFGKVVVAVVCLVEGDSLTLEELRAFCRGKCPHFMIPRGLMIVEELPRTPSGKIALSQVRDLVEST